MKKWILSIGFLLVFLTAAKAGTRVESIDLNTALLYTQSSIGVDVNIASDENLDIIVQLYDNNVNRAEESRSLQSPDGNTQYYGFHFALVFVEGGHSIDANVTDSNRSEIAWGHKSVEIMANPLVPDINVSWGLIEQYVLPLARSYSQCVAEKADLNLLFTQNLASLKSLQNDVAIANTAKQAAEDSLEAKKKELDSCASNKSICEGDKATLDTKYQNSISECNTEKANLKAEKEDECNQKIGLKDQVIQQRDGLILEKETGKLGMEYVATFFGLAFMLMISIFLYLGFTKRVRL